jgi:Zn-dependent oligopeptidase
MDIITDTHFDKIWNLSGNDITQLTKNIIEKSSQVNNKLANIDLSIKKNYNNFLSQLSDDNTEISNFHSIISFLQFVSDDITVKKASYMADILLNNYQNTLNFNINLYTKIVEFYKTQHNLTDVDKKFLKKMVRTYRKNGIDLHSNDKELLFQINQEINKIETHLYNNFNTQKRNVIKLNKKEIDGMPKSILNKLTRKQTHYKIEMNDDNYLQTMRYLSNSKIRKNIEFYRNNQFNGDIENIARLLVLRNKKSLILGYKNYSDFKSKHHMVKNSDNIKEFLNELIYKLDYRFAKEIETIKKIKNKNDTTDINSWDIEYYIVKWKRKYGLDEHVVKQYFPVNHVVMTIFKIYEELFSIVFKKSINAKSWHDYVTKYDIYDEHDTLIGYLYLDLFQRQGKIGQTRCFNLRTSSCYPFNNNKQQIPIIALIADLQFNNIPNNCILTHSEVISIFHEMTHVIYQVLCKSKYLPLSGSNAETDFIQIPALTLDNLCWDNAILKRLSKHYKTGESLSDEIINKMIKIRNLNIGIHYKKIILSSIYDQFIHASNEFPQMCEDFLKIENDQDRINTIRNNFADLYKQLHTKILKNKPSHEYPSNQIEFNNGTMFPFNFDDILLYKNAVFYSLLWSKINASDIYNEKFKNISNLNKIGTEFKKYMFENDHVMDGTDVIKKYLGREPNVNGFLILFGLETDNNYSFFNSDKLQSPTATEIILSENKNNIKLIHDESDESIESNSDSESNIYSNRFSEIQDDEIRFTENSVQNKINYIQSKIKLVENNYMTENTETLKKYNSIFIKH